MEKPTNTSPAEKLKAALALDGVSLEVRGMLRFLILRGGSSLVGVEVGVWHASNAINYLRCLPIQKMYLIDPYRQMDGYECAWISSPADFQKAEQAARKNITDAGFSSQIEFIIKTSIEAAPQVPGNLDFVYLDGDHSADKIFNELELYWPKVRWGGVIGGHDFGEHVQQAVFRFLHRPIDDNYKYFVDQPTQHSFVGFYFTGPPYNDWWLVKDEWSYHLGTEQPHATVRNSPAQLLLS